MAHLYLKTTSVGGGICRWRVESINPTDDIRRRMGESVHVLSYQKNILYLEEKLFFHIRLRSIKH